MRFSAAALSAAAVVVLSGTATAQTVTFETLVHGEIITNQFEPYLTITVDNFSGPDIGAVYDTTTTGGADPDLEDPWSGGNLPSNFFLGNMLIIAENDTDTNNDGILDNPDDEAGRPAGTITLEFGNDVTEFGFDLVDIEGTVESSSLDFYLDGGLVGSVDFSEFEAGGAYDSGVIYGDNYANRVNPISASSLGGTAFDTIVINVGGSGAFDNFLIPDLIIPAPGSALALGSLGLMAVRRRRR
ncbi:MAG: hypothetical protein DHS20C14_05260 [Phycisphaeraceae bacterium]|nr:MAG: hypothetical protein DHS20C14_05260 [Phycisphaeraceae bacterium]